MRRLVIILRMLLILALIALCIMVAWVSLRSVGEHQGLILPVVTFGGGAVMLVVVLVNVAREWKGNETKTTGL